MILTQTRVSVVDNTGGRIAECFRILVGTHPRYARIGSQITVAIKSAVSAHKKDKAMSKGKAKTKSGPAITAKKGDVFRALVIRTSTPVRRPGIRVRFDDNAIVLLHSDGKLTGQPIGTRVSGPLPRELAEEHPKVIAMARYIV